jgi:hypothetical protein
MGLKTTSGNAKNAAALEGAMNGVFQVLLLTLLLRYLN